eukprot:TRINITY_DN17639_c0_g1_i2.p1 TRINITY_DN17639_c0_g1~~TRINITY_DN17639_c0_g1_i2.p1  ORF type:complete len:335 (+),score=88.16 TRINITY_DN17639_c0_g1_i2:47-1051(+)
MAPMKTLKRPASMKAMRAKVKTTAAKSKVTAAKPKKAAAARPKQGGDGRITWVPAATKGWHERNMRFWRRAAANVTGMTGGGVSSKDLALSKSMLAKLVDKCKPDGGKFARALDVGAGIGRVASALLKPHCSRVDLLEPVARHLDTARERLGGRRWQGRFMHGTLQSLGQLTAGGDPYDLIWCQWVLMYITDRDVSSFLRLARSKLLARGGLLVVKENVASEETGSYFDDEAGELWQGRAQSSASSLQQPSPAAAGRGDQKKGGQGAQVLRRPAGAAASAAASASVAAAPAPMSVVRTREHYEALFEEAGLRLLSRVDQHFSDAEMPMSLFVLF